MPVRELEEIVESEWHTPANHPSLSGTVALGKPDRIISELRIARTYPPKPIAHVRNQSQEDAIADLPVEGIAPPGAFDREAWILLQIAAQVMNIFIREMTVRHQV